jgi:hypothetical protein
VGQVDDRPRPPGVVFLRRQKQRVVTRLVAALAHERREPPGSAKSAAAFIVCDVPQPLEHASVGLHTLSVPQRTAAEQAGL